MLFLLLGFPRGSWINKNIFNPLTRALCITGHIRTRFGVRMSQSTLAPFSEWTPALHGTSSQWTFAFISAAFHCDACCVDVETFGAFWYFLVLFSTFEDLLVLLCISWCIAVQQNGLEALPDAFKLKMKVLYKLPTLLALLGTFWYF